MQWDFQTGAVEPKARVAFSTAFHTVVTTLTPIMKTSVKLVFTGMASILVTIGLLAIATEVHTGYSRFQGIRTLVGDDAVWLGRTCLLLAVLPLLVWLPTRWVGPGVVVWWVAIMSWAFGPFLTR